MDSQCGTVSNVCSSCSNCIASLGSIGGATNNKAIANIMDPSAFAKSAVELVTKFGFDGVDIDDETAGPAFNATRAVAVVEATRAALTAKDKSLLLTYDAYFYEGDQSWCADPVHKDYARCFPTALLPSLDWINIMAYNVAEVNATAVSIYEKALNTTFAAWKLVLNGDFTKATIGICVDGSCDFGPGPSKAVIARWNAFARVVGTGGGMMVYAASGEVANDFSVTRSVLPRTS
jgi:GH18 family chitinase